MYRHKISLILIIKIVSSSLCSIFCLMSTCNVGCTLCLMSIWICYWLDIAIAKCRQGDVRARMTFYPTTSIWAKKLRDSFLQSLLMCTSQCIQEKNCYYMTVSDKNRLCTYYSLGSTSFNVTQLATYVKVMQSIEVSSIYCLY